MVRRLFFSLVLLLCAPGVLCDSGPGNEQVVSGADVGGDGTVDTGLEDPTMPDDGSHDSTSSADAEADPDFGLSDDTGEDTVVEDVVVDAARTDNGAGEDPVAEDGDVDGPETVRVVVAGDSWSAGMAFPEGGILRAAIEARGFENVTIDFETTAIPGSQAEQWATNDEDKLDLLAAALDADPPAEVLFITLGGNDFLSKAHNNLGKVSESRQERFLDRVQGDLQTVVDYALFWRPRLTVVIVGYDYLNYFAIEATSGDLPDLSSIEFNALLVGLEQRKLEIAENTEGCEYAHNLGILQYRLGDALFSYGPEIVPFPGSAPEYQPFPGGNPFLPSPLAALPLDGVHPTAEGHRFIIDNTLDQGLENVLRGYPWQ